MCRCMFERVYVAVVVYVCLSLCVLVLVSGGVTVCAYKCVRVGLYTCATWLIVWLFGASV